MRALKILGFAAALLMGSQANAIVIDNFKEGNNLANIGNLISWDSGFNYDFNTIGLSRRLSIVSGASTTAEVTNDNLYISKTNTPGQTSIVRLIWNNNPSETSGGAIGLGGRDLTDEGNALGVDITSFTGGPIDLNWKVTNTGGANTFFGTTGITGIGLASTTMTGLVSIVTDANAIQLDIILPIAATDLVINLIASSENIHIPEPSLLALLGVSALGIAVVRRRQR